MTGGGPGGRTWLRSRSPVLKASGALTRAGAGEWPGLAVTACVRLLSEETECNVDLDHEKMHTPEMISEIGGGHGHCDEPLHITSWS